MIYHITTQQNWENAQKNSFYTAESLQIEGFIHCSTHAQVGATLERFFKNVENVIVLEMDEQKLISPLKYERATDIDQDFPHIFGNINLDAVIKILNPTDF